MRSVVFQQFGDDLYIVAFMALLIGLWLVEMTVVHVTF